MSEITDPRAVRFANEQVRPLADQFARDYWRSKALLNAYAAQNLADLIPNDPTAQIMDGSPADGRPPLTGALATAMLGGALGIVTWAEEVADPVAAPGIRRIDVIMAIAVNGIPA